MFRASLTRTPRGIGRPPDKPELIRPASPGALYRIAIKDLEHDRTDQHRRGSAPLGHRAPGQPGAGGPGADPAA
ncbi:hypothetical protein ABW45_11685 [Stenotrophomonas maltophilia]|nr:hypothetical protein ABW45_11685 [Stenotrophomonas maltophilia]